MKHRGPALWRVAVVVTVSLLACASAAGAQGVSLPVPLKALPQVPFQIPLATESYLIPSRDRGVQLYVRNKHPQSMTQYSAARTVLFVHGATYPSETSFDLEVGGFSWMDYLAQRGWDAYLMDVRGYGHSTRPPEMSQPPHTHPPIANTDVAVRDLGAVVDHILARRGIARLSLIGWSWGTSIVGGYAAQSSAKVERLVLYAPIWTSGTPSRARSIPQLGAYRTITKEEGRESWLDGLTAEQERGLIPPGWFEAWWKAMLESDPVGAAQKPPVVRAPNGVVEDGFKYWSAGTATYNPGAIIAPTLVVHGEWDNDTPGYVAQAVLQQLTHARFKRYAAIPRGTHSVIMERNRETLFRTVQAFLEEKR